MRKYNLDKLRLVLSIIGVLLGVATVLVGICFDVDIDRVCSTHYYGSNRTKFGAEYYTYQYDATADVANNTYHIGQILSGSIDIITEIARATFVVLGLLIILRNAKELIGNLEATKKCLVVEEPHLQEESIEQ